MNQLRRAAAPAYVVAAILILFFILDLAQAIWPLRLGEVGWRVVTAGLVSRVLVTPVLGLLLAFTAALLAGHRRVLKTLAVIEVALALLLLLGMGAFALDALQMRTQVASDARSSYDLGLMVAFAKFGVGFLFLCFLAVSGWRSAARLPRESGRKSSAPARLVMKSSIRHAEASAVDDTAHSEKW